jgi:single-stranded-DNA-specific exonuclease
MDNEEPLFLATGVRLSEQPKVLKDRHIKLQLATGQGEATIPALGWRWSERFHSLGAVKGTLVDIAYRLRHNDHPDFGGIELELEEVRLTQSHG